MIKNEINVKNVDFDVQINEWVDYVFKPDYKKLGPKLGEKIGNIAKKLNNLSPEDSVKILDFKAISVDGIELQNEDIEIQLKPKKDLQNQDIVDDFLIHLDINLNDDLLMERFSRELVSSIQKLRKDSGLYVVDRIKLQIISNDPFVKNSVEKYSNYIKSETLATQLHYISKDGSDLILDKKVSIKLSNSTT